jgi:NADH-quinone oxidoreductase subunit M
MGNALVWLLVIPTVAAIAAAVLGQQRPGAVRWVSLGATTVNLLLALALAISFAGPRLRERPVYYASNPDDLLQTFQPPIAVTWDVLSFGSASAGQEARPPSIQFYVGCDGLNIWLIVLTTVLMVSGVLVSWTSIHDRMNEFYAWLLLLETAMLGVFMAFDIILFYVFFELTLVPLFFLIGIWGGPQRRYAARKFFIYTLTGSMITLLGVVGVVLACQSKTEELTFSIPRLVEIVHSRLALDSPSERAYWAAVPNVRMIVAHAFGVVSAEEADGMWGGVEFWVFLALTAGFAIKVPLVPLHTWLPLAHVEAPTAGSVLLAGILLKIGTYGFLRLCLPLAPDASLLLGVPLIGSLAVVGIVYGALCALAQDDIKKLVAYSSVSHLGFCMLGMFALNAAGLSGSLLQMINHGLSTGALFLLVGMLYERYHTRMMGDYGGLGARLHLLSCFMVFFCLTSIGLPGLNGFIGEVLVLLGMYERRTWMVIVGATGIVLGAWYLLTMLMRVFFGPVKEPLPTGEHGPPIGDLNLRELAALIPIAVLCVGIGVYPQPILKSADKEIRLVANYAAQAQERQAKRSLPAGDDLHLGTGSLPPKSLDDRLLPAAGRILSPPRKERREDQP